MMTKRGDEELLMPGLWLVWRRTASRAGNRRGEREATDPTPLIRLTNIRLSDRFFEETLTLVIDGDLSARPAPLPHTPPSH